MREIIRMRFGSHLYGTATPESDTDLKAVFIPSARDILLQRVKGTIVTKREKAKGERNVAGDVDEEAFSLQRYLTLLSEGQTVALDMLFAPEWAWIGEADEVWHEIVRQRWRLLSRRAAAFLGYCRTQANRYGVRGSRVAAARKALEFLKDAISDHGGSSKLAVAGDQARALTSTEHITFIPRNEADARTVDFLEVCGRKLAFTASLASALDTIQRLVDEYGHRALAAERNEGIDWKALSHAVRVGTQALELLETGHITFPLPNAAHVLSIKKGEMPFKTVGAEIEDLLDQVTAAAEISSLPDTPDMEWIDAFVAESYGWEVASAA